MGTNRIARCGCGEITGVACAWEGDPGELVEIAYIPEYLVGEAQAIRQTDPAYSPLGRRVMVHPVCAAFLLEGDDYDMEPSELRAIVARCE